MQGIGIAAQSDWTKHRIRLIERVVVYQTYLYNAAWEGLVCSSKVASGARLGGALTADAAPLSVMDIFVRRTVPVSSQTEIAYPSLLACHRIHRHHG